MKILLLQSYITVEEKHTVLTEPLGLIYLASYLEQELGDAVEVKVLDLFALGYDHCEPRGSLFVKGISEKSEIVKRVGEFSPDIVGITCNFTSYAEDSYEVATLIKEFFPHIFLVMGGAHVTMEAEKILKEQPYIDFIVRGEGEITFCELVKTLKTRLESTPPC